MMSIVIWVPCERTMPPNEEKEYLITVIDQKGTEKEQEIVLIAKYTLLKIVDNKAEWAFTRNVANSCEVFTDVVAWAHMPDPYDPSDEAKSVFGQEDKECIE